MLNLYCSKFLILQQIDNLNTSLNGVVFSIINYQHKNEILLHLYCIAPTFDRSS